VCTKWLILGSPKLTNKLAPILIKPLIKYYSMDGSIFFWLFRRSKLWGVKQILAISLHS
jgi:hypothetical protein